MIFEVAGITTVADYFLICSAESERQLRAIRDHIEEILSENGFKPFSSEGEGSLRWILMDFSDLIVHVFKKDVREFYGLERLWGDAPQVDLERELESLSGEPDQTVQSARVR